MRLATTTRTAAAPRRAVTITAAFQPRRYQRSNPSHFQVMDISPPPESLGVHCLPPGTTNGDEIEIDGQFFIVEKTRVRWKLERGRYVRDHKRLDVLGTGRYLSNMFLNSLLEIETSDEEGEGGGRR